MSSGVLSIAVNERAGQGYGMKNQHFMRILLIFALADPASDVSADAPLTYCRCNQGDFHQPGLYAYEIDSAGYPTMEFMVGTNDLDRENYQNVQIPVGWQFAVEPIGMPRAFAQFAYHEDFSTGPNSATTTGRVRWWTDNSQYAIVSFTFSFEHPWIAEDVGWELHAFIGQPPSEYVFFEDWQAPVGAGSGPLHGPHYWPAHCWENPQCGDEYYCYFSDCAADTGICLPRPNSCAAVWDPVCSCNGSTYANSCLAALSGVSVAYEGACKLGDLDLDGDVDLSDLAALLGVYHTCVGDSGFLPAADFDGSGCIDLSDLAALLGNYGH